MKNSTQVLLLTFALTAFNTELTYVLMQLAEVNLVPLLGNGIPMTSILLAFIPLPFALYREVSIPVTLLAVLYSATGCVLPYLHQTGGAVTSQELGYAMSISMFILIVGLVKGRYELKQKRERQKRQEKIQRDLRNAVWP